MMMKITHKALAQPPMSWLRKMSMNTMISSQIQMMKRKKYTIVRKKSSSGYWVANDMERLSFWSVIGENPALYEPMFSLRTWIDAERDLASRDRRP
jgi:hypothetical protein